MNARDLAVPLTAGLAVAAGSTALAGVVQGTRWLAYTVPTVALIVLTGVLVRQGSRRWWASVSVQLLVLVVLLTALFSRNAVLGVLPGPAALGDMADDLGSLGHLFDAGVPPVPVTDPLLMLICMAFGVLAIAVDALAAVGYGAAACGLALLCAYTVSTTLAPDTLPSWTLAAGGAGFAALLVVEHNRRQAASHPDAEQPDPAPAAPPLETPTVTGPDAGRGSTRRIFGVPAGIVVTVAALGVALLVGVMATAVGSMGRFPGHGAQGEQEDVQFGLNPFTSLRGQLSRPKPTELLRVRGLPDATYLRALTLSEYVPSRGWQLPAHRYDATLDSTLPTGLPAPLSAPTVNIEIDNVGYRDRWLPLAGLPLGVTGVIPGRWHYDVTSATAYTSGPVAEPRWVERAMVLAPTASMLNAVASTTDVDPTYLDTSGIDPRITRLTATLTSGANSQFAKVVAVNKFFLDPANGFRYSLKTAPGNTDDALVDFLLRGKVGYCEQFASSMAVMLRTVGIPSRVAVGFTPGLDQGDVRSIGTQDAHAWVEAFFVGQGWLTFDPTPLSGGRAVTPSYMSEVPGFPGSTPPPVLANPQPHGQNGQDEAPTPQPTPDQAGGAPLPSDSSPGQGQDGANPQDGSSQPGGSQGAGSQPDGGGSSGGAGKNPEDETGKDAESGAGGGLSGLWRAVLTGLLIAALAIAVAAAPSTARRLIRRKRLTVAAHGGVDGAAAAWRELLAESQDRGGAPPGNRTVRSAARLMVTLHRLDPVSSNAVRAVVSAVERGWYAQEADSTTGAQLVAALRQIRTGLEQAAPLSLVDRLWPRSVRPRLRRPSGTPGVELADQVDPPTTAGPVDRYAETASRR